jgi:CrcB protein
MHPFTTALWLAGAGAVGTLLRAGLTTLAVRLLGPGFPWGTLAVNLMGSFAFGLVFAAARDRGGLSTEVETILLVGLLGGFTTYSSFAFQAAEMLEHGRLPAAAAYVLATNMAGIAAVWLGLRAGAA